MSTVKTATHQETPQACFISRGPKGYRKGKGYFSVYMEERRTFNF